MRCIPEIGKTAAASPVERRGEGIRLEATSFFTMPASSGDPADLAAAAFDFAQELRAASWIAWLGDF